MLSPPSCRKWEKGTTSVSGKNKHDGEKYKLSEEIESLKDQLSATQKENEKLKGDMFGMSSSLI